MKAAWFIVMASWVIEFILLFLFPSIISYEEWGYDLILVSPIIFLGLYFLILLFIFVLVRLMDIADIEVRLIWKVWLTSLIIPLIGGILIGAIKSLFMPKV